jgi:uncharacterized protein involved in tellurium resistance
MGERRQVVLHVLGRVADRFRWGNSAEGEHFKELGTAWKKKKPPLIYALVAFLLKAWSKIKDT